MNLRSGTTDKQQACLVVEYLQRHFVTKTAENISTYNELDKVSTQKVLILSCCLQQGFFAYSIYQKHKIHQISYSHAWKYEVKFQLTSVRENGR